jgi:hypothetical protein
MTGRALLNPKAAEHIVKLLGMLGSVFDNEVVNAGRLADQFVKQLGLRWCDIIVAPPEWQRLALMCRAHAHMLSDHELNFLANISRLRKPPSDAQLAWLTAIYERLHQEAA